MLICFKGVSMGGNRCRMRVILWRLGLTIDCFDVLLFRLVIMLTIFVFHISIAMLPLYLSSSSLSCHVSLKVKE